MQTVQTVENGKWGKVPIENLDRIYEVDGRCLGKVTKDGFTTIFTGIREEDVLHYWRVTSIKD